MSSRVFFLEPIKKGINVSAAEKYGAAHCLFDDRVPSPLDTPGFQAEFRKRIVSQRFNPDVDYFVIVGSQARLVLAALAMKDLYTKVRLLIHNASGGGDEYVARWV